MTPRQRSGLLVCGGIFATLFVAVGIAQGIGRPGVPADAVAIVEGAPGGTRTIPISKFRREMRRAGVEAGLGRTPKPGDAEYGELRNTVLTSLLSTVWLEGLAEETGVSVHPVEVNEAFREYKARYLSIAGAYRRYLARTGQTTADVKSSLRAGLLQSKIQSEIRSRIPEPSAAEIEAYYEAAKSTVFTRDPTRDVRLVVVKDRARAEESKESLEQDGQGSEEMGGLFERLTAKDLWGPLGKAFFAAPLNRVEGPLETPVGHYVFEVVGEQPGTVEPLDEEAESRIRSQLRRQALADTLDLFQYEFEGRWRARTICADDYLVEICGNFVGPLRPPGTSPTCYVAGPPGTRSPCPAPVRQPRPALPGSVSPLEPLGEQLPQRPRPQGLVPPQEPAPFFPGAPDSRMDGRSARRRRRRLCGSGVPR